MSAGEECSFVRGLKPSDVALLQSLASETAEKTASRMLLKLGLDPDDPLPTQAIFAVLRDHKGLGEDLTWVRRTRERNQGFVGKAIYTMIGVSVLGAIQALYTGAATLIGHPIPPLR
jgi:hypothetical protein